MEKIKFTKDNGSDFYKELRKRVNEYFSKNGLNKFGGSKMILKLGLYFSLVIGAYSAIFLAPSLTWFYAAYFLVGISVLLTAFNVSHDAAHGVVVKSKKWNKRLFNLSFNLLGNNAYVWGKHHNESHHLYTNVEGSDIDVLNNPLFRMTATQELKWFHRYQKYYAPFMYLFYSLNWFFIRETVMLFNYSSRTIDVKIPKWEVVKLIFFKLFYVGYMIVIPILVLPFGWEHVLIAFFTHHFLIGLIFVGVLGVSHVSDYVTHPEADENGKLPISWPSLQMKTCVDYSINSSFLNWTLGGFNAHSIHHLLPDVCHIHYMKLIPIFKEVAQQYNVTYMEVSYLESIKAHFRQLHKMGTQLNPVIRPFESK